MKSFLKVFIKLILLPVYYLSHLIPRNKQRWVFGEANGFNNNSKYFYLEVINEHKELDAVWISGRGIVNTLREKGLPAYYRYSFKGLWYSLTSKVYIVSSTPGDINFYTSGGAFIVNLWHGVGIKACLWSNPLHKKYKSLGVFDNLFHYINYPHLYHKPNVVLSTSDDMAKAFFAPMFDVNTAQCITNIYPRCRFMMQDKRKIIEHIKKYESKEHLDIINKFLGYRKVIIYAPTFRDSGEDFISQSGLDFDDLNEWLVEKQFLFVLKLHPATNVYLDSIMQYSNILYLDKYFDSYLIMPFTHMLVSDYSSIVYDYMLLGKPIEIFAFDFAKYCHSSRNTVFNLTDAIQGFSFSDSYCDLKKHLNEDNQMVSENILNHWWTVRCDLFEYISSLLYER